MIRGNAKFDGIAVGEITANFIGPSMTLQAKAAFVNSRTGDTHGWTTNKVWSPTVIEKLKELRMAMEVDLAAIHLDSGEPMVASAPSRAPQDMGGLGEHMSEGHVSQV